MHTFLLAAAVAATAVIGLAQTGTSASAGTLGIQGTPFAGQSNLHLVARQGVNSGNVTAVYYPGGRFVRQSGKRWVEMGDNGARFNFRETGFDESTVYLVDRSRNVQIALDVSFMRVLYAQGNENFRPLYQITDMERARRGIVSQNPPSSHVVTYSCNEGIPLVVRYVVGGKRDLAFASHDGFPEVRMVQVRSGSGTRYASNGYELQAKGPTAIFTFNGNQDVCRQQ